MARPTSGLGAGAGIRMDRRSSPAVNAQSAAPVGGPQFVAVADVATNPRNPEARTATADPELVASIARVGVLAPALLTSVEEWVERYPEDAEAVAGRSWVLQDGHRRYAAALAAGVAEIPFVRRGVEIDETVLRLATAYHSKKLTPLEEAINFSRLVEQRDMTQQEIASLTGVSQAYIANRLRLLTLPDAVQSAVDRGAMPLRAALELGRGQDADMVARVGSMIAEQLQPAAPAPADAQSDPADPPDPAPVPQINIQSLLNEANEARRREEAEDNARQSAADLGGEFVADIRSRFPGTHKAHRLQSTTQIEKAAAKNNLLVAPAERVGTDPEYYALVLERGSRAEETTNREEALRAEAAATRMDALKRAVQQNIPSSLLQEALIKITLAGIGLSIGKTSKLAYDLAVVADLAPEKIGDWTWQSMLPRLSSADQARSAWIIALASIERHTEPPKIVWGEIHQWYFATLNRVVGYEPTEWEQARLDALRKDA